MQTPRRTSRRPLHWRSGEIVIVIFFSLHQNWDSAKIVQGFCQLDFVTLNSGSIFNYFGANYQNKDCRDCWLKLYTRLWFPPLVHAEIETNYSNGRLFWQAIYLRIYFFNPTCLYWFFIFHLNHSYPFWCTITVFNTWCKDSKRQRSGAFRIEAAQHQRMRSARLLFASQYTFVHRDWRQGAVVAP